MTDRLVTDVESGIAPLAGIRYDAQRFGQDTVTYGLLPPHRVPYTGAKIAFQRVPDRVEFRE